MGTTAPTYDQFIAQYPAFASTDQPLVEGALSLSTRLLDEEAWGDFFSDAVSLDAAHNLAIDIMRGTTALGAFKGAAGPMTGASAAGASASFSSPPSVEGYRGDAWYAKTVYGQKFMRLRAVVIVPGGMCA